LFASAFITAAVIPAQLILVPAEVDALGQPAVRRLAVPQRSLRLSATIAAISGGAVLLTVLLVGDAVSPSFLWPMAGTAALAAAISPLQDHVRRVLHLAEQSWKAALVSAVQFIMVIGGLFVGVSLDAPQWWTFGSLVVANAISITIGLLLAWTTPDPGVHSHWTLRGFFESGKWLLAAGLVPAVAGFGASALVSAIGGPELLGQAEGARQIAQPLLVLTLGMTTVFSPRLMEAASRRDRARSASLTRWFNASVLAIALVMFATIGGSWPWNPLVQLLPNSYTLPGLVSAMLVANALLSIGSPLREQILGARQNKEMAGIESVAAIGRVASAFTVNSLGAFAIPVSIATTGIARLAGWQRYLRGFYRSTIETTDQH
jgi:hypothetical protein